MIFINECGCQYDYEILKKSVTNQSKLDEVRLRNEYRVFQIKNSGYPMLTIGHKKYRIHQIIMPNKKGYHVHHIDENVLNNNIGNLKYVTPKEHLIIHKVWAKADKNKLRLNGLNGSKKITRHDVTSEKVHELRSQGYTIPQMQKKLECGYNTIWRRLYSGNPKLLDWSDEK